MLKDRVLTYLKARRDKILEGGINSIPSPFERFSSEYIGIEQGKYYCVTASTKVGKTQLASYLFLYNPLFYAYENPDKIRLKIFYYSLEESATDVMCRFICHLLYRLSGGEIRYSPVDLQSSKNIAFPQEVLDLLKDGEYKEMLDFFERHVEFSPSRNPTGVYMEVLRYMEEHGTIHTKKKKFKDEFGVTREADGFDYYQPNDPDEYVIVLYDHASLIQEERGMDKKRSMDKLSEYFVILRNQYNVIPVLIQQQAFENENLEAFKAKRLRPTAQGLSDSKYISRDVNVLLGVFSPFKFELPEYLGYDITALKNNVRFLEVILNRGGNSGGIVALFFDGAVCEFRELPLPNDQRINDIYSYCRNLRKKAKLFLLLSKFKKHGKLLHYFRQKWYWKVQFNPWFKS